MRQFSKIAGIALVLAVTAGCYDFTGELGKIGFVSNLSVGGPHSWSPESGIAEGTHARFAAADIVDDGDSDRAPDVSATVKGRLDTILAEDKSVTVSGRSGTIRFDGEMTDLFRVDFRPVHTVAVQDATQAWTGLDLDLPETFAMVQDSSIPLSLVLRDRRGRALGWNDSQMEMHVEGVAVDFWGDGALKPLEEGTGSLYIAYAGTEWEAHEIVVVAASDVVSLTAETEFNETADGILVHVTGWTADGLPVYGLPLTWEFSNEASAEGLTVAEHARFLAAEEGDVVTVVMEDLVLDIQL